MKRLFPSSLLGQVMLVLALGLLTAQSISTFLLYQAAEQRRQTDIATAIAFRLIADSARADPARMQTDAQRTRVQTPRNAGRPLRPRGSQRRGGAAGRFRLRLERTSAITIAAAEPHLARQEEILRNVLEDQGFATGSVAVTRRLAGNDPFIRDLLDGRPAFRQTDWQSRRVIVAAVETAPGASWITVRIPEPPRPTGRLTTIVLQTLVIFVVLVLMLYAVLRRITRPLAKLTERVSDFSRNPDAAVQLQPSGPSDTRRLIAAHNAMEARIAALIDEKDVMLGAIGHDLKTPLAALRVRIESVPDEAQRQRMADSIEDITATLDDILSLSRIGRDGTSNEAVELGSLAISVAEEFEDLGEPVTMLDPPRVVARVQVTWIKRALRNLVSNALRYGEDAQLSLFRDGAMAVLRVEDCGPGIPEDRIAAMQEPFTRGEASRNRTTGGAGLGLALSRAIAEQHGGELVLANRAAGGLMAELRLPLQENARLPL